MCLVLCFAMGGNHSYVDYYRCVNAKGEDFVPCKQFFRAYNSLCPNEWVSIFHDCLHMTSASEQEQSRSRAELQLATIPNIIRTNRLFSTRKQATLRS